MRILHLLNHTRQLNGHVHAAVDLACAQKALGHDVAVASEGGDFDDFLRRRGIPIPVISHQRKPLALLQSLSALRREVRTWRPDVIHAHMMTSAVLAWPVCKLAGIPLVTTVHNEFERSAILMGLGTRVIAISEAVRVSMERRGIPARKLVKVLNGTIGSVRSEGKSSVPMVLEGPSILFVAGLHPRKGLPDLLSAFERVHARHPEARLYVLGDGPNAKDYAAQAAAMDCGPAITFAGPQLDPFQWMRGADIFVLPSHSEPAGLVLSEAREAGCAVIGTAVGGIPEMLEHGAAGQLVPAQDPEALAEALLRLLDDPALLAEWKHKSQFNIENMGMDRVTRQTLDVYQDALSPAHPPRHEKEPIMTTMSRRHLLGAAALLPAGLAAPARSQSSAPVPPADPVAGRTLVFEDPFQTLDTSIWNAGPKATTFDSGFYGRSAFARIDGEEGFNPYAIVDDPMALDGKALQISVRHIGRPMNIPNYYGNNDPEYQWVSGNLQTARSDGTVIKGWRHGYFEARMWVPEHPLTWPAFWMLNGRGILTPPSTELDVLEHKGWELDLYGAYLHEWSQPNENHKGSGVHTGVDITKGYHDFGLLIDGTQFMLYFDRKPVVDENTGELISWTIGRSAELDQTGDVFFPLLTLALHSYVPFPNPLSLEDRTAHLRIDHFRVYQ